MWPSGRRELDHTANVILLKKREIRRTTGKTKLRKILARTTEKNGTKVVHSRQIQV